MIGNKLKVARSASGLSLRALADTMDGIVSAQAIGKYERNEDMPSSRVLIALARALAVSEEYLLSEDELSLEGVDFRKKVGTSAREVEGDLGDRRTEHHRSPSAARQHWTSGNLHGLKLRCSRDSRVNFIRAGARPDFNSEG